MLEAGNAAFAALNAVLQERVGLEGTMDVNGRRYVDWVGADIYSEYATPGIWAAFKRFYRRWDHWPAPRRTSPAPS